MRFSPPEPLLRLLRELRASGLYVDETMRREDAFLLYGGLGPSAYLTGDGRILQDFSDWDDSLPPVREASDDEAVSIIVVGASRIGVPTLLDLLPPAPLGAAPCTRCEGTRWITLPNGRFVCPSCSGRGYGR